MAHAPPHSGDLRRRSLGGEHLNSTLTQLPYNQGLDNQPKTLVQSSKAAQTPPQATRTPPTFSNQNNTHQSLPSSTMMGPGVSWKPDPTGLPLYPSEETLAAEYRTFLESYQHPSAPQPARGSFGYPHDADDVQRHESRDSRPPNSYSTAGGHSNYASPDPYPPLNATSHNQTFINTVDRNQHGQEAPDRHSLPMQSLSPESFSSGDSPHAGHYQYQHYIPADPQPYYPTQWLDNTTQGPQISTGYQIQQGGEPTPIRYPRPTGTGQYNPQYGSTYPQYTHQQSTGVAPSQISAVGTQGRNTGVGQAQMQYVLS